MDLWVQIEKVKISVIIPVYNVEKYLKRCLDSVINQTYKNLEIILIDDGSTDNSGKICDEYAQKDERIIVIHKENGGVSSARNKGLDICIGDYISFIDSDDWINLEYFRKLYNNLIENNSDISCCDYIRIGNNDDIRLSDSVAEIQILNGEDILKFYLKEELTSPCAKLYDKKFWVYNRFPIGKTNEDIFTIFKVFSEIERIVYDKTQLYYYYRNYDSTTKSKFSRKNLDLLHAWKEVLNLSRNYSNEIQKLANFRLKKAYFSLLGIIAYNGMDNSDENNEIKNFILKNFKENYIYLLKSNLISFNRKLAIICMRISFSLCCKIGSLIRYIR